MVLAPVLPSGFDASNNGTIDTKEKRTSYEAMYFCNDLSQWLSPEASGFRGLCVSRDIDRSRYQDAFDHFLRTYEGRGKVRDNLSLSACVDLNGIRDEPGAVRAEAAMNIAGLVEGLNLPEDLIDMVKFDAEELAETMSKLLPTHQHLHVKLESFGETSRCSVWHQDHYVARAIVSYCGPGTEYVEDSNFNFLVKDELRNAGGLVEEDNERLIRDPDGIKSVGCGDMLLIKGNRYPCGSGGLLHKSPAAEYDSLGRAMYRLCLKVDVKESH